MPTFDELRNTADNRKLVRKVQKYVGFIGKSGVELPESLFTAPGQLVDLATPAGDWTPLGIVTPSGWTYSREVEKSGVPGMGYASDVRSDPTAVPRTIGATLLEKYKKRIQEILYGTNLDGVTMDPDTGEVVFDEPEMPVLEEVPLLIIGSDGPTLENWVMGMGFHAVELATGGGQTWGSEDANSDEVTFDVRTGEDTGTPVRHYVGGTGALKYADDLGWTVGTGV